MPRAQRDSAFLNIPNDLDYEDHFLAYIAGVAAFGLDPRATLELTGGERRQLKEDATPRVLEKTGASTLFEARPFAELPGLPEDS